MQKSTANNSQIENNNEYKIVIVLSFFIIIILVLIYNHYHFYQEEEIKPSPIPTIKNVFVDDNNYVNISFDIEKNGINDKVYFLKTKNIEPPSTTSTEWQLLSDNNIKYYFDDIYYSYLKNEDDVIIKVKDTDTLGIITNLSLNKNTVYLAINDKYTPTLNYDYIGNIDNSISWYSESDKIAKVNQDGKITAIKKGSTKIHAKISNKDVSLDLIVTDLINKRPKKYNKNKKYVPCGIYNKEENDLLDKILEDKVKDAGYKTRAGVVEVGRFITLDFPYKIKYFSENGRLTGNGVDGEGRYYHKGLYLDESRFKNLNRSAYGPATWGCSIYSIPAHEKAQNGLDCSGFISWVLYNGGFNVKDVGAGIGGSLDLTDYGKRTSVTQKLVKSGKIKVGDLLANGGYNGGHIALIVGEDDLKYYVVESLWTYPNVGALMMEYNKSSFHKSFNYVMLMDSYYKKDGNLTKMWY